MNLKSDPLADAADMMREAGVQLDAVSKMMDSLEAQQHEFIVAINKVLDYTDKLELERNAWRFRAEEMEKERDSARGLLINLRKDRGEGCCPECGELFAITVREGSEHWVECPACKHREDADPV
jgi:rubrerythrin